MMGNQDYPCFALNVRRVATPHNTTFVKTGYDFSEDTNPFVDQAQTIPDLWSVQRLGSRRHAPQYLDREKVWNTAARQKCVEFSPEWVQLVFE